MILILEEKTAAGTKRGEMASRTRSWKPDRTQREMLMEMPAVQDQKSKLPDKGLRGKQEKGPTRGSAAL